MDVVVIIGACAAVLAAGFGFAEWRYRNRREKARLIIATAKADIHFDDYSKAQVFLRNVGAAPARNMKVTRFRNDQLCRDEEVISRTLSRDSSDHKFDLNVLHDPIKPGVPNREYLYRMDFEFDDDTGKKSRQSFRLSFRSDSRSKWSVFYEHHTPKQTLLKKTTRSC